MHQFNPSQRDRRRPKCFESQQRSRLTFDRPVVLLDNVIEILGLPQSDASFMGVVVIFNPGGVGTTLVDRDLVRQPRLIDRFAKKA